MEAITQKEFEFDKPARISRQAKAILERLENGMVSNVELSQIAIRYSARIHELRKAGHPIEIVSHDRDSGVVIYALKRQR